MKDKGITLRMLAAGTVLLMAIISAILFNYGTSSGGAAHDGPVTETGSRRAASDDTDDSDDRTNGFVAPVTLRLASSATDPDSTAAEAPSLAFNLGVSTEAAPAPTEVQWNEYATANFASPTATDPGDTLPRPNVGQGVPEQNAILSAEDFDPPK